MWFVVIVGSKRRSVQSRMLRYDWKKDPRLILDANWTGKLISEVLKRIGWKLNEIRKFCVSGTSYYIIYIKFVYIRQYNNFLFYGLGTFINQFPSLIHIDLEVFFPIPDSEHPCLVYFCTHGHCTGRWWHSSPFLKSLLDKFLLSLSNDYLLSSCLFQNASE